MGRCAQSPRPEPRADSDRERRRALADLVRGGRRGQPYPHGGLGEPAGLAGPHRAGLEPDDAGRRNLCRSQAKPPRSSSSPASTMPGATASASTCSAIGRASIPTPCSPIRTGPGWSGDPEPRSRPHLPSTPARAPEPARRPKLPKDDAALRRTFGARDQSTAGHLPERPSPRQTTCQNSTAR